MATNILSVLGVDSLALRGYQTEYNRFSRFFKSEAEAMQAITTGDYVPVPGGLNLVIIGGLGIMLVLDLQNLLVWLSWLLLATKLTAISTSMVLTTTFNSTPLLVVQKLFLT